MIIIKISVINIDKLYKNLTLTSHISWNIILELDSFVLSLDDLIFNDFVLMSTLHLLDID
jgi:hypothetical protein